MPDDTDAKPSPAANPAPDADEQRLPLSHPRATPPSGTRAGHRVDDNSIILIRELSMIRSAAVQQGQVISNLHNMITGIAAQQVAFEERFSSKLDDVLTALKACAGCSRVERIEMQIEKLRDR